MSLVSIVYRSGRKPINKQALNSILPHEDERRVKKKKRKTKNRGKSRVVRVVKTRKNSVEARLARRGEVKLSRVRDVFDGDMKLLRNEAVEKVDYVVVGVDVGRRGRIRIRINGVYYSVLAMIDCGFLDKSEWGCCTGSVYWADCVLGTVRLLRHFGLPVPEGTERRYKEAEKGLVGPSLLLGLSLDDFLKGGGCGPRSRFMTSGQETDSPFSFANATQRGRCGYGGTANTVRNREMKGGGR